jgi:TolB protein
MNGAKFPSAARILLTPALLLLAISPAVAGDPPMVQIAVGSAPSWSPDSDWIVYSSGNSIRTIPANGGNYTQLTTHPAPDLDPDWSPTGSEIVFVSYNRSLASGYEIFRIPATGGPETWLTGGTDSFFPDWSPDGSQIVYAKTGPLYLNLWVMPRTGGPGVRITFDDDWSNWSPAWSPDGTQIAFTSGRSGNADIWVMPATGGPATQLTTNPEFDGSPSWSPDGTQIVFESVRGGQRALWVMPATGEPETQLTFPVLGRSDSGPAWSPDGTRIAFTLSQGGDDSIAVLTLPTASVGPGVAPSIQDLALAIDPHPVGRQSSAVSFELAVAAPIRLALYGCDGRAVDVLASGNRASGGHHIEWDARGVAPGVYFLRLETDGASATRKVVVLDR